MSLLAANPDDSVAGPLLAADVPASGAGLTAPSSGQAPLVDPSALQDLGEQVNSAAVAKGFARDYAQMWDQRYEALETALGQRDEAAALDAVLSLKTSSSMVGGVRLAELAAGLEELIRSGNLDDAVLRLGEVAARGSETVDELQFSYVHWEG